MGGLGFSKFQLFRRWIGGRWYGYQCTGYISGKRWIWYEAPEGAERWQPPHDVEWWGPDFPRMKARK